MTAPFFAKSAAPDKSPPRRINPWRMFVGSMIPNWLQCRREISQGAKLAYARLAQYAGKGGDCFPRQITLAAELGVSERTANEYIRALVKSRLIEKERLGLGLSNRYFFLDHPWIQDGQPATRACSGQQRQEFSAPDRQLSSGLERQEISVPNSKENQQGRESDEIKHTHRNASRCLPVSLDEAVAVARQLGIEEEFARQEYHAKKAVGWRDGYRNPITSWPDHLQARWPHEQRKRAERRDFVRTSGKRGPSPPRQFDRADYQQPTTNF